MYNCVKYYFLIFCGALLKMKEQVRRGEKILHLILAQNWRNGVADKGNVVHSEKIVSYF